MAGSSYFRPCASSAAGCGAAVPLASPVGHSASRTCPAVPLQANLTAATVAGQTTRSPLLCKYPFHLRRSNLLTKIGNQCVIYRGGLAVQLKAGIINLILGAGGAAYPSEPGQRLRPRRGAGRRPRRPHSTEHAQNSTEPGGHARPGGEVTAASPADHAVVFRDWAHWAAWTGGVCVYGNKRVQNGGAYIWMHRHANLQEYTPQRFNGRMMLELIRSKC